MPLYDYRCQSDACGLSFEHALPLSQFRDPVPCPKCQGVTERVFLPAGASTAVDSVVVFRAPDGTFRFPGDVNGISAAKYAQQGFERIEARGWAQVRQLETKMNSVEASRMSRMMERRAQMREQMENVRRRELSHVMSSMSELGKAVAREAIRRSNARPTLKTGTPGLFVEAYSYDRSSRDESRDRDGRRRNW